MAQIYREMMDQTERVYNFDSPRQTPKPKMIGNYEVQRILGRGAYGTVKLAVDTITGEKVSPLIQLCHFIATPIIFGSDLVSHS